MRKTAIVTAFLLVLAACGGNDTGGAGNDAGDSTADATAGDSGQATSSGGGNVQSPQPPGQGYASVDEVEYTLNTPGGLACEVTEDQFSFSYVIGDNEVSLGGGASISGGEWFGSMTLMIFADNGVTSYSALILDNPTAIAVDGDSVSYSGPMEKQESSSDGSLKDPVPVGDGTFSSTCG